MSIKLNGGKNDLYESKKKNDEILLNDVLLTSASVVHPSCSRRDLSSTK